MKNRVAAGHGLFQGGGVAEITDGGFGTEAFDVLEIAGCTNQEAEIGTLPGENAGNVGAEESGSASEEEFQEGFSVVRSQFSLLGARC